MTKLFLGEHFEAGLNAKGEVYVWDSQRMPSSSDPDIKDNERKNIVKLPLPDKSGANTVKFTRGFLWILTGKGDVY